MLNLPPYSKKLYHHLLSDKKLTNSIFIFSGDWAWHKCQSFGESQFVIALPRNSNFYQYDFPVVDCEILLMDQSDMAQDDVEYLAWALFRDGASRIVVCLYDKNGHLKESSQTFIR